MSFNAVALVVVPDAENPTQFFLPYKFNLGPMPPDSLSGSRRSRLARPRQSQPRRTTRISATGTAPKALAKPGMQNRGPRRGEECMAWLRAIYAAVPKSSDETVSKAKAAGFTFDNVKEAKNLLKAEGLRNSNKDTPDGK